MLMLYITRYTVFHDLIDYTIFSAVADTVQCILVLGTYLSGMWIFTSNSSGVIARNSLMLLNTTNSPL